jgi:hypothetical protein
MEDRSSRRMRTLVTRMARSRPVANETACALISMMAGSTTRSNQRPDTLMQDRTSVPIDETLLQRTAGPYIRVKGVGVKRSGPSIHFRFASKADVGSH